MSAPGTVLNGPLVPALPAYEKQTSKDNSSSKSGGSSVQEPAPAATAALGQMDTAISGQQDVAKQQGAQGVKDAQQIADFEAKQAAEQEALGKEKLAALHGTFSPVGEAYQQAKTRLQAAQFKYEAMDAPKLFANRDDAEKYRLGISMALAGLGDAMRSSAMIRIGRDPGHMSTVSDIIEGDLQRQRDAIEKARDSVVRAKTGLADANEARQALLQEIDIKGSVLAAKAQAQMRALLSAQKVPQAQIDSNKAIADAEQAKAKYRLDVAGSAKKTIDSHWEKATKNGVEEINRQAAPTGKGPSEGESKLAQQSSALERELANIEKLGVMPSKDALEKSQDAETAMATQDKAGVVGGFIGTVARKMGLAPRSPYEGLSEHEQRLLNAWDNATESIVRMRTGAGMSEGEARREANMLRPQPGDTAKQVSQKMSRLKDLAADARKLSGPSAQDRLGTGTSSETSTLAPRQDTRSEPAREVGDVQRKRIIELIKRAPSPAAREKAMKRYGITEDEING